MNIGHQLCSIAYKCHSTSLTLKLSIQIAGIDIEETCCVCVQIAMSQLPRDWLFRAVGVPSPSQALLWDPSSTTFCAAVALKSFTTTFAPRDAKRSEYVLSRPPPAPVTFTVCPLKESVMVVGGSC